MPAHIILDTHSSASYVQMMEIRITPAQQDFIQHAIDSGRFVRAEDAVQEALSLWEERERKRVEVLATLDLAETSLARGEGLIIATRESMQELARQVKERGRARLTGQHPLQS